MSQANLEAFPKRPRVEKQLPTVEALESGKTLRLRADNVGSSAEEGKCTVDLNVLK